MSYTQKNVSYNGRPSVTLNSTSDLTSFLTLIVTTNVTSIVTHNIMSHKISHLVPHIYNTYTSSVTHTSDIYYNVTPSVTSSEMYLSLVSEQVDVSDTVCDPLPESDTLF